jgi:hypothetical protein
MQDVNDPIQARNRKASEGMKPERSLSDDLLRGADAIAEFMFGDRKRRRQVYHLVQRGELPVFRLGATLCARRSTLVAWIEAQEGQTHGFARNCAE